MPVDAEPTRQKLLDAATRLFAERGVDAVTLGEINRSAGQRNNSALHYHFGNREALFRALLHPFSEAIRERRFELIEAAGSNYSVRVAAEVMVRPQAEFATRGWRERALSRIVADLLANPHYPYARFDSLLGDRATDAMQTLVLRSIRHLPKRVAGERLRVASTLVVHAVSDWARHVDALQSGGDAMPPASLFVENLIDMIAGALGAPASDGAVKRTVKRAR